MVRGEGVEPRVGQVGPLHDGVPVSRPYGEDIQPSYGFQQLRQRLPSLVAVHAPAGEERQDQERLRRPGEPRQLGNRSVHRQVRLLVPCHRSRAEPPWHPQRGQASRCHHHRRYRHRRRMPKPRPHRRQMGLDRAGLDSHRLRQWRRPHPVQRQHHRQGLLHRPRRQGGRQVRHRQHPRQGWTLVMAREELGGGHRLHPLEDLHPVGAAGILQQPAGRGQGVQGTHLGQGAAATSRKTPPERPSS